MSGETILSVAVGVGLAAAAGLRVFVPLLVLGSAARLGLISVSPGFAWLSSSGALAMLSVATVLEIAAYYVPWVDNALDLVAAPMAVLAGVVATAAVITDLPPAIRWSAAIIAGGGTAAAVQTVTSLARLKSTAATAGIANPFLATFELLGSVMTSIVAVVLPIIAILIIAIVIVVTRRIRRAFVRRQTVVHAP